uniref:Uncharacterized protein n=1 Tax=Mastacembelus armatus TaxID=205130 RepID=A0A7N8XG36_9TELE
IASHEDVGADHGIEDEIDIKPCGYAPRKDHDPHSTAGQFGIPLSTNRLGAERVHDGQETVNADAGEEEDAAVHVGVEKCHRDLAEHTSKQPVTFNEVKNPKRQAENKKRV